MRNANQLTCLFVLKGSALNRGMNTGCENLAWGLAEKGITIHILAGGEAPASHSYKVPANVYYHFTGKSPDNPLSYIPMFNEIIRKHKINTVVGWIMYIAPIAAVSKVDGIDFIASQGQMPPRSIILRFFKRALLGQMRLRETIKVIANIYDFLNSCKKLISNSQAVQDAWISAYDLNPEVCQVVRRGIDTNIYRFEKKRECSNRFNLLFAGDVHEPKGLNDLVFALKFISVPITLTLCGKGDPNYVDYLRSKVESYNLGHDLVYTGPKNPNDLVRYYNACDSFVFPSYSEGMPKVLLEAMSCGCPVICSNIKPHQEVVQHNVNGLMVPVKSPKILAEAILQYIENPVLRQTCAINARKTIEERFCKEHEIDGWLYLLSFNC